MIEPGSTSLQNAIAARRAFFEQGRHPQNLIDDAIVRSWTRCTSADRSERDSVIFEPVGRAQLNSLLERNLALQRAASEPLGNLARAVSGAGYVVLLTDPQGFALSVVGSLDRRPDPMRQAFRAGVNLSERAIGTSAMSCALTERRAVRVHGPEHFFSVTRIFHCAAAPIVAPDGELVGTVDITRDSPQADVGALALVSQCAQAIEQALFHQLQAHLIITLSWQPSQPKYCRSLLVAFGRDGEIIALNEVARRFFGTAPAQRYEDLFEGRFGEQADALRTHSAPVVWRMRSGLSLFASRPDSVPAMASSAASPVVVQGRAHANADDGCPEFGDPTIERHFENASRAQNKGLPILVLGETGTGKEVFVRTLHRNGRRGNGPLIALNCAAIPASLIEGELFGHVDGAYTGARRGGLAGKIEQADGGLLFLDEIGDMPLELQTRLLRVLETREVARLGASTSRRIDFDFVCATHHDLRRAVLDGSFRSDLYYRINGFVLQLPPLRLRSRLPALIKSLLAHTGDGNRDIEVSAMKMLVSRRWPGNTRELKHALAYADAMAPSGMLLAIHHFPEAEEELDTHVDGVQPRHRGRLGILEDEAIAQALRDTEGRVGAAARLLGISRATLYRRLRQYGR